MAESRRDRPLGDLLGALTGQVGSLIHKEVELARTEMTANAMRAGRNAALVGVGGAVVYAAFLALMIACIAGLVALGLSAWLAALVVAIVFAIVGGLLIQRGRAQLEAESLAPTRTIDTLRDDADWVKDGR